MANGNEIREARERAGLTQEALGALLGVSMRTVGNWERGQTVPLNRLAKIREVLAGHWKDDESADSVGLSNASDVELLAEIARRFARTTEKAGEQGERDTSPMNQAGVRPADDWPHFDPDERTETEAHLRAREQLARSDYGLIADRGHSEGKRQASEADKRGEESQDPDDEP